MLKTTVLPLVFAVAAVGAFGALLAKPGEGRKQRVVDAAPAVGAHDATGAPGAPGSEHGGAGGSAHHQAPSASSIARLPMDAPIATVNGATLTRAQLENAIRQHASMAGIPASSFDARARDYLEGPAYEKLIERELLGGEARRRGLWPADAEVQAQLQQIVAGLPTGKTLQDALKVLGTDEPSFMVSLRSDMAIGKLFDTLRNEQAPLDDAALRKVYEDNKAKFVAPDTARASHILVRVAQEATPEQDAAARSKATAIRAEVASLDAEGFKKVATEKSDDPSAKANGGDLGSFAKGDMVAEFETAAFALKDGEVSQPVRSPFGYHVIRGGGVRPGGQRSFEEMKPMIVEREGVRTFMTTVDTLIEALRKGAAITRIQEPLPSPIPKSGAGAPSPQPVGTGSGALPPGAPGPHGAG